MKPYYQKESVTIYHGDAREFCASWRSLPSESVITDPVWPNSAFPDVDNPQQLLADVLKWATEATKRIIIHLGCNSDSRFLQAVPLSYPFFRVCWLELACPNYIGRLLYTSDVAYAFGVPPPSRAGARVIPGKTVATKNDAGFARGNGKHKVATANQIERLPHPTPRKPQHVQWLAKYFGGTSVFDPFMGSGTTATACKNLGIPFVGIEREEAFIEIAIKRMNQGVLKLEARESCI